MLILKYLNKNSKCRERSSLPKTIINVQAGRKPIYSGSKVDKFKSFLSFFKVIQIKKSAFANSLFVMFIVTGVFVADSDLG